MLFGLTTKCLISLASATASHSQLLSFLNGVLSQAQQFHDTKFALDTTTLRKAIEQRKKYLSCSEPSEQYADGNLCAVKIEKTGEAAQKWQSSIASLSSGVFKSLATDNRYLYAAATGQVICKLGTGFNNSVVGNSRFFNVNLFY